MSESEGLGQEIDGLQKRLVSLRAEVGKVLVGQEVMLDRMLLGFLAGGHVLLM